MTNLAHQGLFERVANIFSLADSIGDTLSDAEVEGLLRVLPPESANSISALMAPHLRDASLVFLRTLSTWMREARAMKAAGGKIIMVPFNFPPELITAFDNAAPLTVEVLSTLGVVALEGQGERYWDLAMGLGLPDHACSSNTIELGSMLSGEDFRADGLISAGPGGCDANAKIHEFVSQYMDIPQFVLEKPVDRSPEAVALYRRYYRRMVRQLEEFIGEELTEEKLRRVNERANRCTELYYELWEMHKVRPCPIPNLFSLFVYATRFSMWGTDTGVACMEKLVAAARARKEAGAYPAPREKARCLWGYTSIYYDFLGLFNWMENRGITHLADALDLFMPQPVDTTDRDTMLDGMADRAWDMPMTRQMGGPSMSAAWIEDVLWAARELDAEAVIYCGHHACKQTWSVVSILRQELMKQAGIPLLILQTDAWNKSMTPIGVVQRQIAEFVDQVVAPQRGGETTRRRRRRPADSSSTSST